MSSRLFIFYQKSTHHSIINRSCYDTYSKLHRSNTKIFFLIAIAHVLQMLLVLSLLLFALYIDVDVADADVVVEMLHGIIHAPYQDCQLSQLIILDNLLEKKPHKKH